MEICDFTDAICFSKLVTFSSFVPLEKNPAIDVFPANNFCKSKFNSFNFVSIFSLATS